MPRTERMKKLIADVDSFLEDYKKGNELKLLISSSEKSFLEDYILHHPKGGKGFFFQLGLLDAPGNGADDKDQDQKRGQSQNDHRKIGFLKDLHLTALFAPGVGRTGIFRFIGDVFIIQFIHGNSLPF